MVFTSCAVSTIAFSTASIANHAWGNYHWERSSNSVSLSVGDNVDGNYWQSNLKNAISDWNLSGVLYLTHVPGGAKPKSCRPSDGMIEVCSADYGNTGWLGVAQIWVSGDHIGRGTVKVNDFYHRKSPYNSEAWKQLVICQEVGHNFGLGHQNEDFNTDETISCMEYTSSPEGNEQPDSHDYQMLDTIYSHLDGSGSATDNDGGGDGCWPPGKCKNRAAPPAFSMPLPSIEQWGKLVEMTADGGKSVYVQDFGQGYQVITHVTWTLERAAKNRAEAD
jgi:hypothetical protein